MYHGCVSRSRISHKGNVMFVVTDIRVVIYRIRQY